MAKRTRTVSGGSIPLELRFICEVSGVLVSEMASGERAYRVFVGQRYLTLKQAGGALEICACLEVASRWEAKPKEDHISLLSLLCAQHPAEVRSLIRNRERPR